MDLIPKMEIDSYYEDKLKSTYAMMKYEYWLCKWVGIPAFLLWIGSMLG